MAKRSPFKYFKTSPEIIRLAAMLYERFPLSLRNVEDLLHERGIDVSHEAVCSWWRRFGPIFTSEIRKRRIEGMKSSRWRWRLGEVFSNSPPSAPRSQTTSIKNIVSPADAFKANLTAALAEWRLLCSA